MALGKREELELRPVLLRVLTDMFVAQPTHARDEIKQFEAIILGLVGHADQQTRDMIAAKLARFGATPPSVVERLMADGGNAAAEFLAHSSLVGHDRLVAAALDCEESLAVAIARRPDLDEELVGILAARPEIAVARALMENFAAPVGEDFAASLIERGRADAELGAALCKRVDNAALLTPLFLRATPRLRADIILAARRADFINKTREPRGAGEALVAAELERAALDGDRPLFAAILARGLGVSLNIANEIVDDDHGEPLAMAMAALRVSADAAARIFMTIPKPDIAHSAARVRALAQLSIDVAPGAARAIIAAISGAKKQWPRQNTASFLDQTATPTPSRAATMARDVAPPPRKLVLLRRHG
jgi:uncharacterized protein (DUF2336 family)